MRDQRKIFNNLILFKNKNLFCSHLFFILLILSIFFHIFSQIRNDDEFTTIDFYESFSSPKECFKLYHNNPTGPLFLLIDIEYDLYKRKMSNIPKRVNRKYELKLVEGPCRGSLAIKTYGDDFIEMNLTILFSLYYDEYQAATFSYQFKKNFKISPYVVIDTKNNFGLEVNFLDSADDESLNYNPLSTKVKSYLTTLSQNGGFICIITHNNHQLLLWPDNLPEQRGLIIRIVVNYIKNGNNIYNITYPAYECSKNNYKKIEPVFLIYEGHNIDIQIKLVTLKFNERTTKYYTFDTTFVNIILWNMITKEKLPTDGNQLFCLKVQPAFLLCPNNDNATLYISELGYFYHARISKFVDFYGVNRYKGFSRSPLSPCML